VPAEVFEMGLREIPTGDGNTVDGAVSGEKRTLRPESSWESCNPAAANKELDTTESPLAHEDGDQNLLEIQIGSWNGGIDTSKPADLSMRIA
jgi:hypothetical protein